MAQTSSASGADPEKKEEAKNLAKEAVQELKHGNREEGEFLAQEAKSLDPSGASEVLKHGDKDKPKKTG